MKKIQLIPSQSMFGSVALTACFILLFLVIAELFLRTRLVKNNLVPYLGSSHRQLEIQFARIKNFNESESGFNCLFIGSSMVWLGVNPEVFSNSFKSSTGKELTCFNFGIATMPAGAAAVLTEIIVNEYHPEIIIFGSSARDYAIPLTADDYQVITNTSWVKYQSGSFSIKGWMYSNSLFFAHLRNFNRLMRFDRTVFEDIGINDFDKTGFLPKIGKVKDENIQAAIDDAQKWLSDYKVRPENVSGLQSITQYSQKNVQVVLFETPVLPEYYAYFKNGESDFNKYVMVINDVSIKYSVPYIRSNQLSIIPKDGWWNENHLNLKGANIFSDWLGKELGTMVNQYQSGILRMK